jgi:dTMP kinase
MPPFIAFEGIDGSGKGTQARLLYERLKELGRDVMLTAEPTKGQVGKIIREHMANPFLDDRTLALLFAADRVEHIYREIIPALESNKWVITDRYVYSSLSYQGQSVDPGWLRSLNTFALKPDLVVLLDLPTDKARDRLVKRESAFESFEKSIDFQNGVRNSFLSFSRGQDLPKELKTDFFVVNGSLDKGEIATVIWDRIANLR